MEDFGHPFLQALHPLPAKRSFRRGGTISASLGSQVEGIFNYITTIDRLTLVL